MLQTNFVGGRRTCG